MEKDALARVFQLTKVLKVIGNDTDADAQRTRETVFRGLVAVRHDLGRKRLLTGLCTARDDKAYAFVNTILGARPFPNRRTIADKYIDPPFNMFLKRPYGPSAEVFFRRMREDLGSQQTTAAETSIMAAACNCARMKWFSQTRDHMCNVCWLETMNSVFQVIARACVIVARKHVESIRLNTGLNKRDLSDVCASLSSDLADVRAYCSRVSREDVDWLKVVDDMFHILVRVINTLTLKVSF